VTGSSTDPESILERLRSLRAADAPTHGGRVLSYVYDPDDERLDALAGEAIRLVQPVNGLDPTVFPSAAALERDVIGFVRRILGGGDDVVGTVTSGGTESCMLAVKTARDAWLAARDLRPGEARPRLVAPTTVHAAFHKAAEYLGLELDRVPVGPDGTPAAADLAARFGDDVALVVVSAVSYPHSVLDPVAEVAALAESAGLPVHVDACVGGLVLPFWPGLPAWDFRVPGVVSMSADLHKYGYAPKGASVLLQRGRDRQRKQYFATKRWPGYPVVNPTVLGSRSISALAAAWAILEALGEAGYRDRVDAARRATEAIVDRVRGIPGLRVVGDPVGPMLAVALDERVPPHERVDPHHWADAVRRRGFVLQQQPGFEQEGGVRLPRTTHLTVTPVTERVLPELLPALEAGAAEVRGVPPVDGGELLASLALPDGPIDSETALAMLGGFGIGEGGGLPSDTAPLLAVIEALPPELAERLLVELLARLVEPR